MPYNCLHLFSLKAASIAVVAVSAWLTYCGSMDLPVMLMMDMFSFMIFSSVEAMTMLLMCWRLLRNTVKTEKN